MIVIAGKHNGYRADGKRLYYKGGDGGAGQARQMEEDRQRRINAAVATINWIFNLSSREPLYEEQKEAVYDINAQEVTRQYEDAEKQNRFGLARTGLMGGSVDVDSNAELQRKTNEGLMKAAGMGEDAAAKLKMDDERSRQSLISMAQSGIDTGTAQSMAMQSLNAQTQSALGERAGAAIGNIFSNFSKAYLNARPGVAGTQNSIAMAGNGLPLNSTQSRGSSGTVSSGS